MHNRKYCKWISFMIDQLVRSYIVIGWICEKMWFIKLPTENTFVVTLDAFVKKIVFVSPQVFYKSVFVVELITFEILAAERLRLMEFDNRLIIDCFANVVNILIWQFSTNDRFKSEKYESLLGKSISRNELYWALFDKYFWLIVIMWRNRLIPINCNYFCWPSDYD